LSYLFQEEFEIRELIEGVHGCLFWVSSVYKVYRCVDRVGLKFGEGLVEVGKFKVESKLRSRMGSGSYIQLVIYKVSLTSNRPSGRGVVILSWRHHIFNLKERVLEGWVECIECLCSGHCSLFHVGMAEDSLNNWDIEQHKGIV
jgi:hypothetical protein